MNDTWPDDAALLADLRQVIDPEVGANIVDLGLIYGIDRDADNRHLTLRLTFTSPACPMGPMIEDEVRGVLEAHQPAGGDFVVTMVWEPPWGPERMAERTRQALGWDD